MSQSAVTTANKQAKILLQKYLKSRGESKVNCCLPKLLQRTGSLLGLSPRDVKLNHLIRGMIVLDWLKCSVFDRTSFLQIKDRREEYMAKVNELQRSSNIRKAHKTDTGIVHGTKVFFDKDWYLSDAWKKVRYEAIVLHGNRCKCCGRGPKDGVSIHVDHIRPKSLWPQLALDINNLQILCSDCNLGKGNKDRINLGKI